MNFDTGMWAKAFSLHFCCVAAATVFILFSHVRSSWSKFYNDEDTNAATTRSWSIWEMLINQMWANVWVCVCVSSQSFLDHYFAMDFSISSLIERCMPQKSLIMCHFKSKYIWKTKKKRDNSNDQLIKLEWLQTFCAIFWISIAPSYLSSMRCFIIIA